MPLPCVDHPKHRNLHPLTLLSRPDPRHRLSSRTPRLAPEPGEIARLGPCRY